MIIGFDYSENEQRERKRCGNELYLMVTEEGEGRARNERKC